MTNTSPPMVALERVLGSSVEQLSQNERNTLVEVFGALGIEENDSLTLIKFDALTKLLDVSSCHVSLMTANGCSLEILAWTSQYYPADGDSKIGFICHCTGNPQSVGNPVEVSFCSHINQRNNVMDFSWGSVYFQTPDGYTRKTPQIYLSKRSFAEQGKAIIESPGSVKPKMPAAFVGIEQSTISEAYFSIAKDLISQ